MAPKELTRTRLASASLDIDPPRPHPANPAVFALTGTIEIRMKATEKIGGAPAQLSEFLVTDTIDRESDLATGKVTHNRSRPKGVTRSQSVRIRVRL